MTTRTVPQNVVVPAHAGNRQGSYDPRTSIYRGTGPGMRRMRATVGRGQDTAGPATRRLVVCGTSLTAGQAQTPGSTTAVDYMIAGIRASGIPVSEILPFTRGASPADPRVTITSGWTWSYASTPWRTSTASGNSLTFVGTGTVMELQVGAYNPASSIRYRIDGGSWTTITSRGTGSTIQPVVVTGLSDAAHTCDVESLASGAMVFAGGFRYPTGLIVQNASISGTTSQGWAGTGTFHIRQAVQALGTESVLGARALIFEAGANEISISVSAASFYSQANASLALWASATSYLKAALVVVPGVKSAETSQYVTEYVPRLYDLADDFNIPLLDLVDRFGVTYTELQSAPPTGEAMLSGDNVHWNIGGAAMYGRALLDLLGL